MAKNATSDLAHDLRDVADDLKEIVETVVAPRVTSAARAAAERGSTAVHAAAERVPSAVQAAAERVPDSVVDRLPDRVTDRLPVQKSHRGRKLLLLAGLLDVFDVEEVGPRRYRGQHDAGDREVIDGSQVLAQSIVAATR